MELKPTKAQILWLAEKYNTVPLSTTLPATVTPTQVLQKLKTVSRHCYMLESCEDKESSRSEERRVGKECRSRWSPNH